MIGARYAEADVDAFTEVGDPALTVSVEDQELDSLIGSAGIEARGDFEVGGLPVRPYAIAAVEREFQGDARTVRYAFHLGAGHRQPVAAARAAAIFTAASPRA